MKIETCTRKGRIQQIVYYFTTRVWYLSMSMNAVACHARIASLQQQLDDSVKEIEEMKAARRRQAEMVIINELC